MAGAKSIYPTLYEVMTSVRRNENWRVTAVTGLSPKPFPKREGISVLEPEQLLSIRVPIQGIKDGDLRGYQRNLNAAKARSIARYMQDTPDYAKVIPVIEVSVDGHGNAFVTEGQHRAAGGIIARLPVKALVTRRSESEARRLFANQAKASKPSKNVLIFDGDGPYEEYIQDAVTDPRHPWHNLITMAQAGSSKSRMSASAAHTMIRIYMGGNLNVRPTASVQEVAKFDRKVADDLAVLMSAFGSRQTNPLAYSGVALRAIAIVARAVFRSREPHPDDRDRWIREMPRFPFGQYAYLRTYNDVAEKLLGHWNKRLSAERKATL